MTRLQDRSVETAFFRAMYVAGNAPRTRRDRSSQQPDAFAGGASKGRRGGADVVDIPATRDRCRGRWLKAMAGSDAVWT